MLRGPQVATWWLWDLNQQRTLTTKPSLPPYHHFIWRSHGLVVRVLNLSLEDCWLRQVTTEFPPSKVGFRNLNLQPSDHKTSSLTTGQRLVYKYINVHHDAPLVTVSNRYNRVAHHSGTKSQPFTVRFRLKKWFGKTHTHTHTIRTSHTLQEWPVRQVAQKKQT